jgi:hypothetical protein
MNILIKSNITGGEGIHTSGSMEFHSFGIEELTLILLFDDFALLMSVDEFDALGLVVVVGSQTLLLHSFDSTTAVLFGVLPIREENFALH